MLKATFMEMLAARAKEGNRLCIGLDPVPARIPEGIGVQRFLYRVATATAPYAAAFKPNIAFFEGRGGIGLIEYEGVVTFIQTQFPEIPIIGDWKRGDIGATNKGYIEAAFDLYGLNALTVSPYLSGESLKGFLDREDRGIIALCRTSNPGSDEFQGLMCEVGHDPCEWAQRVPLYQFVAHRVSAHWNSNGNCGLVVGATFPDELAQVHGIAPELFKLIPGVGTQGGDLAAAIRNAFNPDALPDLVINVSSGILYAYKGEQFQTDPAQFDQAAAKAAEFYDRQIRDVVAGLS